MEQINSNIPLQVYNSTDYQKQTANQLQLQSAQDDLQDKQAERVRQKSLRESFQGADTSSPDGQKALLEKVGQIDPAYRLKLEKEFTDKSKGEAEVTKWKAEAEHKKMEVALQHMDVVGREALGVKNEYQSARSKGLPEAQALKIAQDAHVRGLTNLFREGVIDADKLKEMMAQPFDVNKLDGAIAHATSVKEQLHQRLEQSKADESKRHNTREEGIQGMNAQTSRMRENREAKATGSGAAENDAGKGKTGDEYLKTLPEGVAGTVKGIADGRISVSSLSIKGGHREAMLEKVMRYNPNYSAKDYNTQSKAEKDFATGKQGNNVRSFNVALEHLDTLQELSDGLGNKNTQIINKASNAWKTATGDSAPTNFNAAKQLVADEVVKAIVGSGGGVHDREEAAKTISDASSPEQLKGVIDTYKKLFKGQLHGLQQQYKATTGKDDFDDRYLTKSARSESSGKSDSKKTVHWDDLK